MSAQEQKSAIEALQESEILFRTLFEKAIDGIIYLSSGLEVVELNEAYAAMHGYTVEEMRNVKLQDLDVEDISHLSAERMRRIASGEDLRFDVRHYHKDGHIIDIEVSTCMIPLSGGNIFVALHRDVTERKRAEHVLRQSESRARQQRIAIASLATKDVLSSGNIDATKQMLAETLCTVLQVERSSVWLLSDDGAALTCIELYEAASKRHSHGTILQTKNFPRYFEAIHNESRIAADDARTDSRTSEFAGEYLIPLNITSMLDVGIALGGKLVGVVCMEHIGEQHRWFPDEEAFAGTISSLMAQAMVNESRTRAEDRLKESETRYRQLIETMPDGLYRSSREGKFIEVNQALVEILGYDSREDLLAIDIVSSLYFTPEERDGAMFEETQHQMAVYRLRKKDGSEVWVEDHGRQVLDDEGGILYNEGVLRDVTERKQAEDALKSSMALLETILESTDNGILVVGADGRVLKVNGRFTDMWRIPAEVIDRGDDEMLLKHILFQLSDPEAFLAKVKQLYVEPTAESFDLVYFNDGRVFERISKPMLVAGIPEGRTWSFRDITERKVGEQALLESEERYRAIVENIGEGIGFVNSEERFVFANTAAGEIFGCGLVGMSLDQFVSEDQYAVVRNETALRVRGNKSVYELEIVRPNGDKRNIIVTAVPKIDKERGFTGTYGVFRDITERKETEQLLRDMQRRESIGILSGGIAHDFNNLLGSMMGNISLAQAQLPADHLAVKNMENALTAIERAAKLTQQMLAYSGKGKFQIYTMDLAAMVDEHVGLFNVSLTKNVKLVTHIPSTPVYVNGDPSQIEQIIMNLIINGGEAIGDRPGVVSITLSAVALGIDQLAHFGRIAHTTLHEGVYASLEVSDSGVGMSQETLMKIFDPFFTTKFTGRGLGLSAMLGIVQGHKGGITVESTEGEGTTFRIVLPSVAPPAPVKEPAGVETPSKTLAATILVIDDEQNIATMAQEILEMENYTSLIELNPLRGIELYAQRKSEIGAVLLDLTMPEMSGKEVVDALRAINPGVKIIITSGYSQDEVTKKIDMASVSGFIQKPYRMQSLLTIVQRVLTGVA